MVRDAWEALPPTAKRVTSQAQEREVAVGKFIASAWIDAQAKYYANASSSNQRWHKRLEICLEYVLFPATFVVAISHVLLHGLIKETWIEFCLSLLAVTLLAIASALAGIYVFGHFERNAERYESMSEYLHQIGKQISGELSPPSGAATDESLSPLQRLVRNADHWMAHEHQGWRFVFGERLPGPG